MGLKGYLFNIEYYKVGNVTVHPLPVPLPQMVPRPWFKRADIVS